MPLAADYPFLDLFWTMIIFFVWVSFFWLLISIAGDVFRRHDIGGGTKALWLILMVFLPFIGVFAYLIANNDGMAKRNLERAQSQQARTDEYVRSVAGAGTASEIAKAKELLDSGAITQSEFEAIKGKALGASA